MPAESFFNPSLSCFENALPGNSCKRLLRVFSKLGLSSNGLYRVLVHRTVDMDVDEIVMRAVAGASQKQARVTHFYGSTGNTRAELRDSELVPITPDSSVSKWPGLSGGESVMLDKLVRILLQKAGPIPNSDVSKSYRVFSI